ncbi:MAP3K12-binding inhibitory protein 1-like [Clytia hemisphaerica]|uniref:MAP3K12-binding inhibitory protein 1-like n=1 Tax=Clytia hemisphaerica TaxID=252671 RepID=UPI0034D54592|eukprot:TCONS_00069441-protein
MEFLDEITNPIQKFMCKLHGMTNDHNYAPLSNLLYPQFNMDAGHKSNLSEQEIVNLVWVMLEELRHILEATQNFPKQMRHWMDNIRPTSDMGVQTDLETQLTDNKYVQITCSSEEFNRRINAFIKRKRTQADAFNRREFCKLHEEDEQFSCARTDSVRVHRRSTKSLLRIERVYNNPQKKLKSPLKTDRLKSWPPIHPSNALTYSNAPRDIKERIKNLHTVVKPTGRIDPTTDVYGTLRELENKVLYLETLSPEYFSMRKQTNRFSNMNENAISTEGLNTETSASYQNNMHLLESRMDDLKSRLKEKMEKPPS